MREHSPVARREEARRAKCNTSKRVGGQRLGIKKVDDGAEKLAAHRQPLRSEVVTYVLGTFCYLCVRAGHIASGSGGPLQPIPQPLPDAVDLGSGYA